MIRNLPANAGDTETLVRSPGWKDPLEERTATNSSIVAWRIPWAEEPGGLWSMGSQRVGHDSQTEQEFYCVQIVKYEE